MIRRAVAIVAIGSSIVAALTGCDSDPELDRQRIAEATVQVRADGCGPRTGLGTGTAIEDGLVVTAAHVVAGSDRVTVVDNTGATTAAAAVFFDPELDVAALRPSIAIEPVAPLREAPGRQGESGLVALVGDDLVELIELEVAQRVTVRTTDIYRDARVERPGLRLTLAVEPGDSGAMVHLPGGGVGVVWSRSTTDTDRAWAVDLPPPLLDGATRRTLTSAVDTGPCP